MHSLIPSLEKDLIKIFRARRKHLNRHYAIFLTNQFQKDQVISFVKQTYKGIEPLITSGTIKKCKKFIETHRDSYGKEEKEISALF